MEAIWFLFGRRAPKGGDSKARQQPASELGRSSQEYVSKAERFKRAFSRKNVKVHFVGAWCVPIPNDPQAQLTRHPGTQFHRLGL